MDAPIHWHMVGLYVVLFVGWCGLVFWAKYRATEAKHENPEDPILQPNAEYRYLWHGVLYTFAVFYYLQHMADVHTAIGILIPLTFVFIGLYCAFIIPYLTLTSKRRTREEEEAMECYYLLYTRMYRTEKERVLFPDLFGTNSLLEDYRRPAIWEVFDDFVKTEIKDKRKRKGLTLTHATEASFTEETLRQVRGFVRRDMERVNWDDERNKLTSENGSVL